MHQHCFRQNNSACIALADVLICIRPTNQLDDRLSVNKHYILLNIFKAFDNLHHEKLLTKLECYCMRC